MKTVVRYSENSGDTSELEDRLNNGWEIQTATPLPAQTERGNRGVIIYVLYKPDLI